MERGFIGLDVAVLAVGDAVIFDEAPGAKLVVERFRHAGHRVVARRAAFDELESIHQVLAGWIADPAIDIVVVTTAARSEHAAEALEPFAIRKLPGFADLVRLLTFRELGSAAMLVDTAAVQCNGTLVFVLPGSANLLEIALDSVLLPQLDHRTGPQNLVMLLPRIAKLDAEAHATTRRRSTPRIQARPATPRSTPTPTPTPLGNDEPTPPRSRRTVATPNPTRPLDAPATPPPAIDAAIDAAVDAVAELELDEVVLAPRRSRRSSPSPSPSPLEQAVVFECEETTRRRPGRPLPPPPPVGAQPATDLAEPSEPSRSGLERPLWPPPEPPASASTTISSWKIPEGLISASAPASDAATNADEASPSPAGSLGDVVVPLPPLEVPHPHGSRIGVVLLSMLITLAVGAGAAYVFLELRAPSSGPATVTPAAPAPVAPTTRPAPAPPEHRDLAGELELPSAEVASSSEPAAAPEPVAARAHRERPARSTSKRGSSEPARVMAATRPTASAPPSAPAAATSEKPVTSPDAEEDEEAGDEIADSAPAAATGPAPTAPTAPTEASCDPVHCILENYASACCAKYKPATTDPSVPRVAAPSNLPAKLDRRMIQAGMTTVKRAVIQCGDQHGGKGSVVLRLKVTPDGAVSEVSVSRTPDEQLGTCAAAAVKRATFAKTSSGGSFYYPFLF